jgi:hypothetical protein
VEKKKESRDRTTSPIPDRGSVEPARDNVKCARVVAPYMTALATLPQRNVRLHHFARYSAIAWNARLNVPFLT